jgi:hypothetical protein
VSAPWSIETEARRLCGCAECGAAHSWPCTRGEIEDGIRAGLEQAAIVATKLGPMNQSDSLDAAARIRALLQTP